MGLNWLIIIFNHIKNYIREHLTGVITTTLITGFLGNYFFSQNEEAQNMINSLNLKINDLEYENNDLKPKIVGCKSELKDLKTNNRITLNQDISNIKYFDKAGSLRDENIALIKTEKQELETNNNKYKKDIFILKNNLFNTEQELSKFKEHKNKSELEIRKSQLLLTKSLSKNKKLLSKIDNLNKNINTKNNEISKLSKKINNNSIPQKKYNLSKNIEYFKYYTKAHELDNCALVLNEYDETVDKALSFLAKALISYKKALEVAPKKQISIIKKEMETLNKKILKG